MLKDAMLTLKDITKDNESKPKAALRARLLEEQKRPRDSAQTSGKTATRSGAKARRSTKSGGSCAGNTEPEVSWYGSGRSYTRHER